ncbi:MULTISPECIES: GlxA family transcriptional regulator [unclassified Streptomyces]|uniref:GlxA family transcriptional regulator n=1 Tax=unclassified Streptomyces TaxID=2593676 RepID=UPI0033CBF5D1
MARVAPARHVVAVVAFDDVQLLDVTGPVEVFTTANAYGAAYDVRLVSLTGRDVRTSAGVRIGVDGTPADLPGRIGTLVVPGRETTAFGPADDALIGAVTELSGRADRVASVCAGAFVLAEAGLLEGRRAATHWQLAAELAARFPRVTVETDPLFVRDGRIITSAGVTAGIDLALALIEEDHGAGPARDVARKLVVFMARPGGQSQFSVRLAPERHLDPALRRVLDAVTADPAADHPLASLAAEAGLSTRHLRRLFREKVGTTPGRFVESVRVEAARALLEAGDDTVEQVARQAGFGSSESLRRAFQNTLGVPPTTYRARFRTTGHRPRPVRE